VNEEDPLGTAPLGALWGLPFAGLLLSIALLPLLLPKLWPRHYGKIAALWALAFLVPLVATHGTATAGHVIAHAMLLDYVPFIVLLLALYTVTGGIALTGTLRGTPGANTGLLAAGTAIASVTGTTGAAMLMIRPVLRANRHRRETRHVFIFFILLVANVGGALSPLGDPPLFLGFMEGVPFFWPTRHLFLPTLLIACALLGLFYAVDRRLGPVPAGPGGAVEREGRLAVRGGGNLVLLAAIVAVVLTSGVWDPDVDVRIAGTVLGLERVVATLLLLGIVIVSLRFTAPEWRDANGFAWHPMAEVAILFAAIFVTIVPVLHLIAEGSTGPARDLVDLLSTGPAAYFWLTGILSAFLDNAPTYLVFFNFAGGDPARLTGPLAPTLLAISMGAVYFGALTYVGNAPNFMVRAIVESEGVPMPSFFGYLFWAAILLLPLMAVVTVLFL
jgi:Na+/H+ antiporter NhaD/arsenite permease-like protein